MKSRAAQHRRSVRLGGYDYGQPGAYFVTIVAHARECIFGEISGGEVRLSERGELAESCWRLIPRHFPQVELGAFVVMPNHLHGILVLHDRTISSPGVGAHHRRADATASARGRGTIYRAPTEGFGEPVAGSIPTIVRTYKAAVTRDIGRRFGRVREVWQRGYHEHVIRDDEDWQRIHLYIEANPANWLHDDENPSDRQS